MAILEVKYPKLDSLFVSKRDLEDYLIKLVIIIIRKIRFSKGCRIIVTLTYNVNVQLISFIACDK